MQDNETTLIVAVIGAGMMGRTHARAWTRVANARVVAVADPQTAKAEAVAQMAAGSDARVFQDVNELLTATPEVNVVSVCVPSYLHRSVGEAALKAGKHVFCEKPLALNTPDCAALIAAAEAAGVLLSVGQVVRFFPEFAEARRLVQSGAVGNPAAVRTRRGGGFPHTDTDWFADPEKSGGVIFDLMVHDLDWLQWCFGNITRVYARGLTERLAEKTLDHLDYALLTMRHESGVISHAEGTWADPGGFVTTFEIAGDNGLLDHDSRRTAPLIKAIRADGNDTRGGQGATVPSSPLAPEDDPYFREIAAFAQAVRGKGPLAVTAQEARQAVAVAAAARESVRTGRAVTVG